MKFQTTVLSKKEEEIDMNNLNREPCILWITSIPVPLLEIRVAIPKSKRKKEIYIIV